MKAGFNPPGLYQHRRIYCVYHQYDDTGGAATQRTKPYLRLAGRCRQYRWDILSIPWPGCRYHIHRCSRGTNSLGGNILKGASPQYSAHRGYSCHWRHCHDFHLTGFARETEKLLGTYADARYYPIGHFDIYKGEHFERTVEEQIGFLQKHLAVL